eukprot:1283675-Rhodomonas_salina.1
MHSLTYFLHLLQRVEPCTDFRVAAKLFDDLSAAQLIPHLPSEVAELRHTAFAANFTAIRLKAESAASAFQISQTVLRAVDIENATISDNQAATWSQVFQALSWDLRCRLLLWHVFVRRLPEFAQLWSILLPKAVLLQNILKEHCGFELRLASWVVQPQPELSLERFSRAYSFADKYGKSRFAYQCDLPLFQQRAQFAAPGNVVLAMALAQPITGALSDDKSWVLTRNYKSWHRAVLLPPWSLDTSMIVVYLSYAGEVTSVFHQAGIMSTQSLGNAKSKWQPPSISWKDPESPGSLKPIPEFDVTRVVRNKRAWEREVAGLTPVARHVVNGDMPYPLKTGDISKVDSRNLPTCKLAEEYCPPGFEQLCICGMGLVCKKTHPFWRLIINFRPVNEFLAAWPSRMTGLAANANLFSPGAVCWSWDISKGYLANVIGGCDAGLHGGFMDGDPCKRFKTKH